MKYFLFLQKTGNAIRALGRLSSLQKQLSSQSLLRSKIRVDSRSTVSDSGSERAHTLEAHMRRSRSEDSKVWIDASDSGIESEAKVGETEPTMAETTPDEEPVITPRRRSRHSSSPPPVTEKSPPPIAEKSPEPVAEKSSPPVAEKPASPSKHTATANFTFGQSTESSGEKDKNDNVTLSETTSSDTTPERRKRRKDEKPYFLRKMRDFEVFEGDSARFEVKVKGEPEPDVTWFKDDVEIKESRKYVFDFDDDGLCILVIKECTEKDDATYECKAGNSAGDVSCSGDLYVEGTGE